jgi:Zn-dependent protease with chaperone function
MDFKISKIKHPKEKLYGSIMLILGALGWAFLAAMLIFSILKGSIWHAVILISYGVAGWFASYVVRALTRAYMFGHYVLVGPRQFPHLHEMVLEGAHAVGLQEPPLTFVYNSSGVMNAMALRLVGRSRYLWLTSALIDADDEEQVRFVIGHELGHHIAGHLDQPWSFLKLPAHFIPFLGAAYSRARELTCDRVGAWLVRDPAIARSALQMLACGSAKLNEYLNPEAFQTQEQMVPPFAGFILHIFSHYPRLTQRVQAITDWHGAGLEAPSRRSVPASRAEPSLA